jgi:hypothetical protein
MAVIVCASGCGSVKSERLIDAGETEDAAVDAPGDAMVDAPPPGTTRYDVAYINEITFSAGGTSAAAFLLVVNKGTLPLDLATASVVTFSDDNAAVDWKFVEAATSTTRLAPEHAAGLLSGPATAQLVVSGLVPEPIDDRLITFEMSFVDPVIPGVTFGAQAVIQIGGANVVLPFIIHGSRGVDTVYNSAKRVASK